MTAGQERPIPIQPHDRPIHVRWPQANTVALGRLKVQSPSSLLLSAYESIQPRPSCHGCAWANGNDRRSRSRPRTQPRPHTFFTISFIHAEAPPRVSGSAAAATGSDPLQGPVTFSDCRNGSRRPSCVWPWPWPTPPPSLQRCSSSAWSMLKIEQCTPVWWRFQSPEVCSCPWLGQLLPTSSVSYT